MSDVEGDLRNQLKTILDDFTKLLECPVCFEVLKCPFNLCSNGHSICTGCISDLKGCPTCQAPIASQDAVIPVCVKDLIEALPQFCRYRDSGCEEIVSKLNHNKLSHEEDLCGFRPSVCQELTCKETVLQNMLKKHYEERHPKRIVKNEVQRMLWGEFRCNESKMEFYPVFINNNSFWLEIVNDVVRQCLRLKLFYTPVGKVKADYFVKVKFEGKNFSYVYTLKAYKLSSYIRRDNADNISTSSEDELEDQIFTMEVPQSSLKYFMTDKGALEYTLSFFNT